MTLKLIDVDNSKWKAFKKWCAINEITMKDELDKRLNKYVKEVD